MKQIPLTQGKFALVDDEDFEFLNQWKWCASKSQWGFYAMRGFRKNKKQIFVLMHRLVAKASIGVQVDHINRNGLDNQKSNLRLVNQFQNNANIGVCSKNTSGFKGVGWHKGGRKWKAAISNNDKTIHLGLFIDPKLAAAAYDNAAIKLKGEYACTNKSLGLL
jgi:hypothetical protein